MKSVNATNYEIRDYDTSGPLTNSHDARKYDGLCDRLKEHVRSRYSSQKVSAVEFVQSSTNIEMSRTSVM